MKTHQRHLSFQGSTTTTTALSVKKTTLVKKVQEDKEVSSLDSKIKKMIYKDFPKKSPSIPALTCNKKRDYIRDNIAKSLSKAAEKVGVGSNKIRDLALSIKIYLHKAPKKQRYLSVLCNLKDNKNPNFRKKVLQGLFASEHISSLAPMDMASEARKLETRRSWMLKKRKKSKLLKMNM